MPLAGSCLSPDRFRLKMSGSNIPVISESVMRRMLLLRPEHPNRWCSSHMGVIFMTFLLFPLTQTGCRCQSVFLPITAPIWVSIVGHNKRNASACLPSSNCWAANGLRIVLNVFLGCIKHGELAQVLHIFYFLVITSRFPYLSVTCFGWLDSRKVTHLWLMIGTRNAGKHDRAALEEWMTGC